MNIEIFLSIILIGLVIIGILYFVYKVYFVKYMDYKKEKINTESKRIEVEKTKAYANIDTVAVNKEVDEWLKGYLDIYILKNITIPSVDYIKSGEAQDMLRNTCLKVMEELSELYRWYISLLVKSDTEEAIIDFLVGKLSLMVVNYVSEFNQPK